uniref:Uncharacterized protein n=1 Tax=Piliocolobus tephrosceles TaxID=591936 RepID=A0A8C9ISK4_9PRIM
LKAKRHLTFHYQLDNNLCSHNQVLSALFVSYLFNRKRLDVVTRTDWLALVIWEGTYNRQVLEKYYKRLNITIELTVFDVESDYFLQFIKSANKYFMTGNNVIFYILLDDINKLPGIELGPLQTYFNYIYMKNLNEYITDYIQHEVHFLSTMSVNQIFKNDFGVETLGTSVARLHAWRYFKNAKDFPCEKRLKSAAFIPFGQGDFYYHSAIFGGTLHEVVIFIKEYQKGIFQDTTNKFNSLSHHARLNKYFLVNKPTKLLSQEYNWDTKFRTPLQIKNVKIQIHPLSTLLIYSDTQ